MQRSDPKVSILLATRNGARFLGEQLQSYRAQTWSNWELLVSDDGSSDATLDIVRDFAARVPQTVIVEHGPQQGFWSNFVAMVRSTAVDGDLFAFSDQDDVWQPEKFAKAIQWFSTVPDSTPALYFSRTELIDAEGAHIGFSPLFERLPNFRNALVQSIGGGNTMIFNRAARSALRATPVGASLVSHDWWAYQIVTAIGGRVIYDSWPSLRYRQHGENLVGANIGLRARLTRLTAFFHGRVTRWNDVNLALLRSFLDDMTPENALTFRRLEKSRHGRWPARLWLLWRSGVHRQGALETAGLYLGALLGRL